MKLRGYQKQAIENVRKEMKKGNKAILLYAPTGSGKTVIASKIILDAIKKNSRILFIIHRHQLVEQTKKTLLSLGVNYNDIGFIKAGYKEKQNAKIIIASIQSMQRRQLPNPKNINLIIVDECHTTSFYKFYKEIDKRYDCYKIGLSASPWRKKPTEQMSDFFDALVKVETLTNLIKEQYLATPKYYSFDSKKIKELEKELENQFNEEEFKNSSLKMCEDKEFNSLVVQETKEFASSSISGITFCATVNQSKLLCELFNESGIISKHVDKSTSWEERENIFSELKNNKIQNICSVGILTEGFDAPNIEWVTLARPINSKSLYVQILGRVLRPFPGKQYGYILDFGGNLKRFERKAKYIWKNNCQCPENHHFFLGWDHDIKLNEEKTKINKNEQKTCPECGAIILKFFKICPECGHIFEQSGNQNDPSLSKEELDRLFKSFGEINLFSNENEQRKKFKYLRRCLKNAFKNGKSRDSVYDDYFKKYKEVPPAKWYYGAIFGGKQSPYNFRIFLDYLYKSSNKKAINKKWIDNHFCLEFGDVDPNDITEYNKMNWSKILGVSQSDNWDTIKRKYFEKIKNNEENAQLLDWAIDKAREFRK